MTNPSGPIAILCGYDANGVVRPALVDVNGKLTVITELSTIDAADVTYTPSTLSDWNSSADPGNQAPANDQLASRTKTLETATSNYLLPVRAVFGHDTDYVVTGNAIVTTIDATEILNYYAAQNVAANGDVFINSAVLKAGAYTIRLIGVTNTNGGKLDIDFKHVNDAGYTSILTGQNWYAGVNARNQVKTGTFTVVTSGRHIFKFTVNGKDVASGGYNILLTKTDIYLTAGDS